MARDDYEVQIDLTEDNQRILAPVAGLPLVARYKAGSATLNFVLDPQGETNGD